MILRFSNTKRQRRTVRYDRKVGIRGRLINADGKPIAGAELRLLTRDLRQGASAIDRRGVRTRSDGSFRVTVRAKASRQLQFAWRARANDVRFAANGYLTLQARAAGTLRVSPARRRASGARVTLTRPAEGRPPRRRAGRPAGQAARRAPLHDLRRHHLEPPRPLPRPLPLPHRRRSRGRTFVFRARIRRAPGFPYETGTRAPSACASAERARRP